MLVLSDALCMCSSGEEADFCDCCQEDYTGGSTLVLCYGVFALLTRLIVRRMPERLAHCVPAG